LNVNRRALLSLVAGGTGTVAGCSALSSGVGSEEDSPIVTPPRSIPACTARPSPLDVDDGHEVSTTRLAGPETALVDAIDIVTDALNAFRTLPNAVERPVTYEREALQARLDETEETLDGEPESVPTPEDRRAALDAARSLADGLDAVAEAQRVFADAFALGTTDGTVERYERIIDRLQEAPPFVDDAASHLSAARDAVPERAGTSTGRQPRFGVERCLTLFDALLSGYRTYAAATTAFYRGDVAAARYQNSLERPAEARSRCEEALGHYVETKRHYCEGVPAVGRTTGRYFSVRTCVANRRAEYFQQYAVGYTHLLNDRREAARDAFDRGDELIDQQC
jgi:hypothetical protein